MHPALLIGIGLIVVGGLPKAVKAAGDASPQSLANVTSSRAKITVSESQDVDALIDEARRKFPGIKVNRETMAGARLIASEHGSATAVEAACIVDAELNRAKRKGKTLLSHLTAGTNIFGRQGKHDGVTRPAATRQNANLRQLEIAMAVIDGDARGISKGAERFFDPLAQLATHLRFKRGEGDIIASCHPLGTLEAWSYDLPSCKPSRCCTDHKKPSEFGFPPPGAQRGNSPDAWVGQISGVDAGKLMLMKPSTYGPAHDARFREASDLIKNRIG